MLSELECIEDLVDWHFCADHESAFDAQEKISPLSMIRPVMALSPAKEMETWLIRSGLSPQANLPASRIGIYTDFS